MANTMGYHIHTKPMPASTSTINRLRHGLLSRKVVTFLICLLVASVLWLVHALNRNYRSTLVIPVKFINLPPNKVIMGELPDKLQFDIKTSGTKLLFINLRRHFNELVIDFNALKGNAKSQAYSLSTGNLNLNSVVNFDVEILKIRPDTLFFSINKGSSRIVPVKVNHQITCAPGYQILRKPQISPAYITITGDSNLLRTIDTIYTQTIAESNLQANYSSRVTLKKPNASVYYSTAEVQVDLPIDRITEATIQVPVTVTNAPPNTTIKLIPEMVTVRYLVAMKDYEASQRALFRAVVDYSNVQDRKEFLPIELQSIPAGIRVLQLNPQQAKFLLYK